MVKVGVRLATLRSTTPEKKSGRGMDSAVIQTSLQIQQYVPIVSFIWGVFFFLPMQFIVRWGHTPHTSYGGQL